MLKRTVLISLLSGSVLAPPAYAQTAPVASDGGNTDIVVTAQRRESRLQDVPQAVTAFDSDTLERLAIRDTGSLARNTPSLTFTPVGPGESNIGLRGLSTDLGLAPAVAVYINDTPFDFRTDVYSGTPSIDLFDMQRVEVLRGPQGTLFGSSSTGGTIRYITNAPDPSHFSAHGETFVDSAKGGGVGYGAKAAVNLPLASNVALRVTGTYEKIPGYIDRYDGTLAGFISPRSDDKLVKKNANGAEIFGLRAAVRVEASDDLTITPSLFFQRINGDNPIETQSNLPGLGRATAIGNEPSRTDLFVANLTIDKKFGDIDLVSSSSYLRKKATSLHDYSLLSYNIFGEFAPFGSRTPGTADTYAQELRLTSSNSGRFNWIAGLYFSHTNQTSGEIFEGPPFSDLLNELFGPADGPVGPVSYNYNQKTSEQQIAGFAEANFKATEHLELIAGVRVYQLKNTLEASCRETIPGVLCGPDSPRGTAKTTSASPRFTVKYHPVSNATFYATASRGFRSGGANAAVSAVLGCSLALSAGQIFKPDSVWNYEVGAKVETPDRVLTVNGAAYRIEQKGIQLSIPDPCGIQFFANAGDARINGAELEMSLRPTRHVTISGQMSYTDATFSRVPIEFGKAAGYAVGDPIPETPRWKFSLSSELRRPVTGTWEAYMRGSWQHVGKIPFGIDGALNSGRFRPAYDIVNFDLGVEDRSIDISLFVRNAFDRRGILGIGSGVVNTVSGVFENVTYVTPRTIGLNLRIKG